VIFNLAALYSQLAAGEDRSNKDGVKRASAYYQVKCAIDVHNTSMVLICSNIAQNAAGTLAYLISSGIPKLRFSPDEEERPLDLTEPFAKSLEWLMLAQAQECVWQRAVMGE
jgi:programmed cell death 6-interacting protein